MWGRFIEKTVRAGVAFGLLAAGWATYFSGPAYSQDYSVCNESYPAGHIQSLMEKAASLGKAGLAHISDNYLIGKEYYDEAKHYHDLVQRIISESAKDRTACVRKLSNTAKAEIVADEAKHVNSHRGDRLSRKLTDQALSQLMQVHSKSLGELDAAFQSFGTLIQNPTGAKYNPALGNAFSANPDPSSNVGYQSADVAADLSELGLIAEQKMRDQPPPKDIQRNSRSRNSGTNFSSILSGLFTGLAASTGGAYGGTGYGYGDLPASSSPVTGESTIPAVDHCQDLDGPGGLPGECK